MYLIRSRALPTALSHQFAGGARVEGKYVDLGIARWHGQAARRVVVLHSAGLDSLPDLARNHAGDERLCRMAILRAYRTRTSSNGGFVVFERCLHGAEEPSGR